MSYSVPGLAPEPTNVQDFVPDYGALSAAASESRILALEQRVRRLESVVNANRGAPPIDRGMTYYPEGDPIPSHGGPAEYLAGKIWLIDGEPLAFVKNITNKPLAKGEEFQGGIVDRKLRYAHVSPNNYFYLEV